MDSIFGVPWDTVTLDDVARFLEAADAEPQTWEAKADGPGRLSPGTVRDAICAFANSELGGTLIIGATRAAGIWSLPGLHHPPPELATWIGQAAGNISPRPAVDPRTLGDGAVGPVAIVRVEPLAEPPAITNDGRILERVGGESLTVKDPAVLGRLFSRGAAARASALERASRALNDDRRAPDRYASFAAAATGWPPDREAPIYRAGFVDELKRIAIELGVAGGSEFGVTPFMDHTRTVIRAKAGDAQSELHAYRDGSVAVHHWSGRAASIEPMSYTASGAIVSQSLAALFGTLVLAGASGRVAVTMSVRATLRASSRVARFDRWMDLRGPSEEDIEGIKRDLRRADEKWVLDPEA